MGPLKGSEHVSVADYLARERSSEVKHEYVGGRLYAMAGASNDHNRIATDVLTALSVQLRGHPCEAFNSDTKIRIRLPTHVRFYYPDVSVVCRPNPGHDSFQDEPTVIVEVLSPETRRLDEGEKREHYLTIASLGVYITFEQDEAAAIVYRRTESGFTREDYEGLDAVIPIPEIGASLPFSEVYRRIELPR